MGKALRTEDEASASYASAQAARLALIDFLFDWVGLLIEALGMLLIAPFMVLMELLES
jgi:hypothetical protein